MRNWNSALLLSTRQPEQFAIAAVHQRQAASHKADGPVAQVMSLPGSFGNAFGSEQALGDHPIRRALHSGVERPKRQRESLAALWRKLMEGQAGGAGIERAPEAARGMRADIEDIVERQFDGVRRADDRRLFQEEAVFDPAKAQESVPTVSPLSQLAGGQIGEVERILANAGEVPDDLNDCRQRLWRPEYRLMLRRLGWISGENRGPTAF